MDSHEYFHPVLYVAVRSDSVLGMSPFSHPTCARVIETLDREGFSFLPGLTMGTLLREAGKLDGWSEFAASWNDLVLDPYLAQQGRFRRRRHATYSISRDGRIARTTHQAHYQSLEYNTLQGGIERWFEPIEQSVGASAPMHAILTFSSRMFGLLAPQVQAWHTEVHQFRIEARVGEPGQPTPEGSHRDGVDYVMVLLIERHNIVSGTTRIQSSDGHALGEFTLTQPLDTALLIDERVYHGVTPVHALDARIEAHRDVLVATFRSAA